MTEESWFIAYLASPVFCYGSYFLTDGDKAKTGGMANIFPAENGHKRYHCFAFPTGTAMALSLIFIATFLYPIDITTTR